MTRRRKILAGVSACAGLLAALTVLADRMVRAGVRVVDPDDAPRAPVAIVPGAGIGSRGELSAVLEDRLAVAVALYRRGRVKKLLLSGDHGTVGYDEPAAMARYVEGAGVPPRDVFTDHAGFDTWATLYRARHVFLVSSALVVSQDFHLPRALYFARAVGIEATGVRADRRVYARREYYALREVGARVKAVAVAALGVKPRFLGSEISIEGDGRVTR
jgi:SanA protein